MKKKTSTKKSIILLVLSWLLILVFSSFFLYGYHHPDEFGMIDSFYLYKLKVISYKYLAWEYYHQMRSWFQPSIYYILTKPFISLWGYNHLFIERLTILFNLLLLVLSAVFVWKTIRKEVLRIIKNKYFVSILFFLPFFWFLPGMLLRHSSEAFTSIFTSLSLYAVFKVFSKNERIKLSEKKLILYSLFGGIFAGLAFWSRFQMALFTSFFWFTLFYHSFRYRKSYLKYLNYFALGVLATIPPAILIDYWGYEQLCFSPWNYFYQNIILHKASNFGKSPWYWYLTQVSIYTLNPIILLWFFTFIKFIKKNIFYTAVFFGIIFYFLVHSYVPHKEIRFLFPITIPVILVLLFTFSQLKKTSGIFIRTIFHPNYIKILSISNIIILLLFTFFGLTRDKFRFNLALWDLPKPALVITASSPYGKANIYYKGKKPSKRKRKKIIHGYSKPKGIKIMYASLNSLAAACKENPKAYLLLTKRDTNKKLQKKYGKYFSLADLPLKTIAQFPPDIFWFPKKWFRKNTWRYKLLHCEDYR